MKPRKQLIGSLLTLLILANGLPVAISDTFGERKLPEGFYIGAGVGQSVFRPDTEDSMYTSEDKTDTAFSLITGYDLSDGLSLELEYADLGESTFKPRGGISYNIASLNALYYFGGDLERKGLHPFARIGVGKLNYSSDIDVELVNATQLLLGGGFEYGFDNGLALRGELVSHDKDILKTGMSLLYRFQSPEVMTEEAPKTQLVKQTQPVIAESVVKEQPAKAMPLKQYSNILFGFDEVDINSDGRVTLDAVANYMVEYKYLVVLFVGHTDHHGTQESNQVLSLKRAQVAKDYLVRKGIEQSRISIVGKGESSPISNGRTKADNQLNRRVQIQVSKNP